MQDEQSESEIRNIGAQSVANTGVLAIAVTIQSGGLIWERDRLEYSGLRTSSEWDDAMLAWRTSRISADLYLCSLLIIIGVLFVITFPRLI